MDWNTWIKQGVPYVTRHDAGNLRNKLAREVAQSANGSANGAVIVEKERMKLNKESDKEEVGSALKKY